MRNISGQVDVEHMTCTPLQPLEIWWQTINDSGKWFFHRIFPDRYQMSFVTCYFDTSWSDLSLCALCTPTLTSASVVFMRSRAHSQFKWINEKSNQLNENACTSQYASDWANWNEKKSSSNLFVHPIHFLFILLLILVSIQTNLKLIICLFWFEWQSIFIYFILWLICTHTRAEKTSNSRCASHSGNTLTQNEVKTEETIINKLYEWNLEEKKNNWIYLFIFKKVQDGKKKRRGWDRDIIERASHISFVLLIINSPHIVFFSFSFSSLDLRLCLFNLF